jgi:hypothetical protein
MCTPLSMAGEFIPVDAGINLFIGCCSGSRIVWLLDCLRFGPRLLYMRQDSWCVAHVHVGHRARLVRRSRSSSGRSPGSGGGLGRCV